MRREQRVLLKFSAACQPVTLALPNVSSLEGSLSAARERGAFKISEILKGEDMLTATQFGSLIGASHETVNLKRRQMSELYVYVEPSGID